MDNIRRFDISFDRSIYYPGQTIHGDVILDLHEALRIRNIRVLIKGKAHVKWTATKHGERRTHKQDQYFLDDRSIIFGKEPSLSPTSNSISVATTLPTLPSGLNKVPFKFALPNNFLPCSFESRFGNIRYFVRVILDIPFSSPPQETKYFSVIGPPINCLDEHYMSPIKLEKSKILWNMCGLRKGSFYLCTILDRTAYCCGEFLKFKIEINNKSHQNVVLTVQLRQHVEYKLEGTTKNVDCIVMQKKTPKISPLAKINISSTHLGLQIPIVPPTLNNVCRLIHIKYVLKFSLEYEKASKDELHLEFPIIIGTIPRAFKNAPPPKLFYSYCVNHVEGGNYITPEFQTGQVYDGGLGGSSSTAESYHNAANRSIHNSSDLTTSSLASNDLEQIVVTPTSNLTGGIFYKPLYLTLTSPAPKKAVVLPKNISNGTLMSLREEGLNGSVLSITRQDRQGNGLSKESIIDAKMLD